MRHRVKSEKFSRPEGQRRALKKSLLRAILLQERIKLLKSQGRALKSWTEKLITLAKNDTLHNRRLAYRQLNDHALVKRLFISIAPRFKDIPGGYTRMLDFGLRKGDGATLSILELTKREEKEKKVPKVKAKEVKAEKQEKKATAGKKSIGAGVKKIFNKSKKKES